MSSTKQKKPVVVIKRRHAELISELLSNAGYLDDGDEILADRAREDGKKAAMRQARHLDQVIALINPLLKEEERIGGTKFVKIVEEFKDD